MPKSRLLSLLVFGVAFAFGVASCSQSTQEGESGSLSLALTIAGDLEIDEVAWVITGGAMLPMGATIDTSAPGATASIEVFGLPATIGPDYTIAMEAMTTDGKTTCKGSEDFGIDVGEVTEIMVMLNCKRPERLGAVRVNGKFNICAELTKVVVSPLQTSLGNDIDLFSNAQDDEGDPIAYMWSSGSGSIADPTAASTTYTCTEVGDDDITILVSDDGGSYCMSMWTVPVTCVAGEAECQSDEDCEAGDICVAGQCVPDVECITPADCDDENDCTADICADGTCSNPNLEPDESCDQDGGSVCDGQGNCVECNDDTQCDTGELCVANTCVGDPELFCNENLCLISDTARAECVEAFLVCIAAEPLNEEECILLGLAECSGECIVDGDCPDTGNECTDPVCNAGTGQCETSNNTNECTAGGGGELAVNGGFEQGLGLPGWTQFCDGVGTCEATQDEAKTGSWSGRVATSAFPANPLIKQANLAVGVVQPGTEVTIRFSMKGSLTGAGGVVFAELLSEIFPEGATNEILGGAPLFPTDQWVDYEFTTNAGPDVSNGITLQLAAICGADPCSVEAFFDDVSIVIPGGGGEAGTCQEGVCVPSAECTVDGDCPATGNECIDPVCDAGSCGTSFNTDPCDGGAGTCSAGECVSNAEVLYEQNFNLLPIDPGGVIGDGWNYFINVFADAGASYRFGYGGPAPQGPQISNLVTGEGGLEQAPQQLVVYSDYECCDGGVGHNNPTDLVETNVFQERTIGAADVGKTFTFMFQAKGGNLGGSTMANGFIKTLVPGPFNESAADRVDTTGLPDTWGSFSVSLFVDGTTVAIGHILQFGFQTNASNGEPSGNFYDNTEVTK